MKKFYFFGYLFSIILYCTVFFLMSCYFENSKYFIERFTNKKDNFLDIVLLEKKDSQSQKTINEDDKKGSTSTKPKSVDAKNLFSSINVDNLSKKTVNDDTTKLPPSRLLGNSTGKSTKATDILKNFKYKQQTIDIKSYGSSGKYDEYIGKISDILDANWQKTTYVSSEFKSVVKIWIDNSGSFSFSIESLSYNDAFNEKVKLLLEEMKNQIFPPYEGVGKIELEVTFREDRWSE